MSSVCANAAFSLTPSHRNCCLQPKRFGARLDLKSIPFRRCRGSRFTAQLDDSGGKSAPSNTASVADQEKAKDQNLTADSVTRSSRPSQRQADSTDWVASQLTRRFGIIGGLAWVGVLTFGVVSEQIKTRLELASEEAGTKEVTSIKEVVTPSGLRYYDTIVGGGQRPQRGDLVALEYKLMVNGSTIEDTKQRGKPIVFLYASRPFPSGLCKGVEEALSTMKAGGKRQVTVPPELGFGDQGGALRPTASNTESQGIIPPGATLVYELNLLRVSIPPS